MNIRYQDFTAQTDIHGFRLVNPLMPQLLIYHRLNLMILQGTSRVFMSKGNPPTSTSIFTVMLIQIFLHKVLLINLGLALQVVIC